MTVPEQPEPRPALTDAQLDTIEQRLHLPYPMDAVDLLREVWRLRDHAARLQAQAEEMRRDRDVAVAECQRAAAVISAGHDHADRLARVLARLAAWCRRPEWASQAALAFAHGARPDPAVIAEGDALWADVDALLDPPTTTGRAGGSAPTRCEASGVALDDPRDG